MSDRTAVYRFYDAAGTLLYVGIAGDPLSRWKHHRNNQPWWHEVHTLTQDWYPTRTEALVEETRAIRREHPRYNVQPGNLSENPGITPVRNIRMDDELWNDLAAAVGARKRGALLRAFASWYTGDPEFDHLGDDPTPEDFSKVIGVV